VNRLLVLARDIGLPADIKPDALYGNYFSGDINKTNDGIS